MWFTQGNDFSMKIAVQLKAIEEVLTNWKRWKLYRSICAFAVMELDDVATVAVAAAEANVDDADEWLASSQWRDNEHDGVSNYQLHDCLLNRLFRRRSKKTSKLRVTGICASIWWRHNDETSHTKYT